MHAKWGRRGRERLVSYRGGGDMQSVGKWRGRERKIGS